MKLVASFILAALAFTPVGANAVTPAMFHRKALAGDVFEIETARLAMEKSRSPAVRRFARHLMGDHEKSAVALGGGAPPTLAGTAMNPQQERTLALLRRAEGKNFDRLFRRVQIEAHRRAIGLYARTAATAGPDARFARTSLPTLRNHLAMAERLPAR